MPLQPDIEQPIAMLLYCPKCGLQHIDEPDERTPEWDNPPHRSHLCHGCGCIWRPADVPTNGVASIETVGKADTWHPRALASSVPEDLIQSSEREMIVAWLRATDDLHPDHRERRFVADEIERGEHLPPPPEAPRGEKDQEYAG